MKKGNWHFENVEELEYYKTVPMAIMWDYELRPIEKAVYLQICSLPASFTINAQGIQSMFDVGIGSIYKALNELEKHGYLTRHKERDRTGQLTGRVDYTLHANPKGLTPPEAGHAKKYAVIKAKKRMLKKAQREDLAYKRMEMEDDDDCW